MVKMRGADIVAEMLVRLGVEYVSGIPGHTVIDLVDALYDRRDKIKALLPRNEETASFAADAYYRVTGKPMAVFSHISVGSANLLTGVTNAFLDSSAMIVITGEIWSKIQGRGAYQELARADRDAGTPDMFRGSVKRSWQISRADRLPEVMLKAYKTAVSGRPGPVHIDITQDAFADVVDVTLPDDVSAFLPSNRSRGDVEATARAVDLLLSARRPAILAGGGVLRSGAYDDLVALAEALQIPVATTIMGKGSIPEDHPLAMGVSGWVGTVPANNAMREADVLLGIGTRFSETDTSGWTPGKPFHFPPTRLIHVDIDPMEIAKYYPTEVGIVGDARSVLRDLALEVRGRGASGAPARAEWLASLQAARADWQKANASRADNHDTPIHPARLTAELRKVLDRDAIVISDVGNAQKWIAQQFDAYMPTSSIGSMGGAAMGFGACGAVGVALGAPGKQVVAWVGDGSMAMSLHVLPTVVEYNLPIVYIVPNDFAYAAVKRPQDFRFGPGRNHFTLFQNRDGQPYDLNFAEAAKGVGMQGERVTRPEDLAPALRRALATKGPYMLDVVTELDTYVPMDGGGAFPLPPRQ